MVNTFASTRFVRTAKPTHRISTLTKGLPKKRASARWRTPRSTRFLPCRKTNDDEGSKRYGVRHRNGNGARKGSGSLTAERAPLPCPALVLIRGRDERRGGGAARLGHFWR